MNCEEERFSRTGTWKMYERSVHEAVGQPFAFGTALRNAESRTEGSEESEEAGRPT